MNYTNTNKVKAKIVEHGDTQEKAAEKMHLSRMQFFKKVNGEAYFTQPEIILFQNLYNLTPDDVFIMFLTPQE